MFGKWSWDVFVVLVLLLLIGEIDGGLWITLPSAQGSCGSLQSNSYFWDTQDFSGFNYHEPLDAYAQSSIAVPKGDYYFYYNSSEDVNSLNIKFSDVRQYFCTGYVDSMPVGSYCFYQNIQNCNSFFVNLICLNP